jgi:CheY-like chemotaxis protein
MAVLPQPRMVYSPTKRLDFWIGGQLCNAKVLSAGSAEEGLRLVTANNPNVIVSDIGMPGKDGLAMIRELRARPDQVSKTPAIALTAFARAEDRIRAMLAGYQVHLSKPVEPQELVAAIANLAGRTGLATE